MILDRVTITGADDSVAPEKLAQLSDSYPFVEWGILFGSSQGARFPSKKWLIELAKVRHSTQMQLSAHLCSHWVRDLLKGEFSWWEQYPNQNYHFSRFQVNTHGKTHLVKQLAFQDVIHSHSRRQFILQCDGVHDDLALTLAKQREVVPLFDLSAGAGVTPDVWPSAWPGIYCGYAGGLGPMNLSGELQHIAEAAKTFDPATPARVWIDMERHVRSEDDLTFDLSKVQEVLEIASYVVGVSQGETRA